MPWTAPPVSRTEAPTVGDERALLDGWLEYHRKTLLQKCAGLTAEQLRTPAVDPSGLTLHGLVRHMAEVERSWFRRLVAGEFAVCVALDDSRAAEGLAREIARALAAPMSLEQNLDWHPGASIGGVWSEHPVHREELLRRADKNMYLMKATGGGEFVTPLEST